MSICRGPIARLRKEVGDEHHQALTFLAHGAAERRQEIHLMDRTNEQEEFDTKRNEVRVYAVLHARKGRWTEFEMVALRSGLSLADATSALWGMKQREVLEWKWRGQAGVFCLPQRGAGSHGAELEYEARRLRLIAGPWMKPPGVSWQRAKISS